MVLLSENENKKNVALILASQPNGKMKFKDLVRALEIDERAFVQTINLLLKEYSIEKELIEENEEVYDGYVVTKTGIELYDLQEIRDSLIDNPQYNPVPVSQSAPDTSQDIEEESVPTKEVNVLRIFLYVVLVIIAAAAIYLLLTQWLLPMLQTPVNGTRILSTGFLTSYLWDSF